MYTALQHVAQFKTHTISHTNSTNIALAQLPQAYHFAKAVLNWPGVGCLEKLLEITAAKQEHCTKKTTFFGSPGTTPRVWFLAPLAQPLGCGFWLKGEHQQNMRNMRLIVWHRPPSLYCTKVLGM